MEGLLDSMLDRANGPEILSEQNDLGGIDTSAVGSATAADPSQGFSAEMSRLQRQIADLESGNGFWDEAEYGRSRAQQAAIFKEALVKAEAALAESETPEGRAKAAQLIKDAQQELVQRAITRAGLDTSTGKVAVFVAGNPAWHKLGKWIREATDSYNAIRLAEQNWTVKKVQQYFTDGRGFNRKADGQFALYREDTNEYLSSVGPLWKPIQNEEAYAFLDKIMVEFGAKYEAAGAIYGGKEIFIVLQMPQQAFAVGQGDEVMPYVSFFNPHHIGAALTFPTATRAECANTNRIAIAGRKGKGIAIRHTGNLDAKIEDARVALGLSVRGFEDFKEKAEVMSVTQLPHPEKYFADVLDVVLDVTHAQAVMGADALTAAILETEAREKAAKALQRQIDRRWDVLEDILQRWESKHSNANGIGGTVWGAYNSVTESANHGELGGKSRDTDAGRSRKFESILSGKADDAMQVAYREAVALTV